MRTASYKKAISDTVNGKSVLDVGCGSGVLSCFAAEAGAKEVVAVDKADIIDYAHEIAIENMLGDKIRFIHTDLDQADLAIDKVDVIISEWMGYFLLFEGMLDSVIRARDTYLAENGTMIPSTATLYMCAISDDESWQSRVGLWDSAYGLQFGCLKKYSLMYPAVEEVSSDKVWYLLYHSLAHPGCVFLLRICHGWDFNSLFSHNSAAKRSALDRPQN